jgi:23S rRNA G2069 N7-methylase RlmK/C1962 C5-methylase RlmI
MTAPVFPRRRKWLGVECGGRVARRIRPRAVSPLCRYGKACDPVTPDGIVPCLETALAARSVLFDVRHETAFRLFNGFAEGCPDLVVDLYARTLVLYSYAHPAQRAHATSLVA